MIVFLASCGNPDRNQYSAPSYPEVVTVADVESAVKMAKKYRDQNDLGGGNWSGGEVYENGAFIGRIAYNGRFITAQETVAA